MCFELLGITAPTQKLRELRSVDGDLQWWSILQTCTAWIRSQISEILLLFPRLCAVGESFQLLCRRLKEICVYESLAYILDPTLQRQGDGRYCSKYYWFAILMTPGEWLWDDLPLRMDQHDPVDRMHSRMRLNHHSTHLPLIWSWMCWSTNDFQSLIDCWNELIR